MDTCAEVSYDHMVVRVISKRKHRITGFIE